MKKLLVKPNNYVLVDDEDYEECNKHTWHYNKIKKMPQTVIDHREISLPQFIMQLHSYIPTFSLKQGNTNFSKSNITLRGVRKRSRQTSPLKGGFGPCQSIRISKDSFCFISTITKERIINPFTKEPFIAYVDGQDMFRVLNELWYITTYSACTKFCPIISKKRMALHRFIINAKKGTRYRIKDGNLFNARRNNIEQYIPTKTRYVYIHK